LCILLVFIARDGGFKQASVLKEKVDQRLTYYSAQRKIGMSNFGIGILMYSHCTESLDDRLHCHMYILAQREPILKCWDNSLMKLRLKPTRLLSFRAPARNDKLGEVSRRALFVVLDLSVFAGFHSTPPTSPKWGGY
jgi:hypothetical protein